MKAFALTLAVTFSLVGFSCIPAFSQEAETQSSKLQDVPESEEVDNGTSNDTTTEITKTAKETVSKITETLDQDKTAQETSAGILQPIYLTAEYMEFSAFHWVAFSLMVAGVICFAAQLTLGKLAMLMRMHFSVMEILNDALGLLISAVGLVLTTQAAAQNSTFTQSPAAVLSSTALGGIVGIIFYWHGQSQEIKAARADHKKSTKKE